MTRFAGWAGAIWGLCGVVGVLAYAVFRLSKISIEAFDHTLAWNHWASLIANVAFMAYYEGYRGFQKSYSPKVAARARDLLDRPRLLPVLLAPPYCMHYFDSTRRQMMSTYLLTVAIVVLVILVHELRQPWRGLLDVGVVVGLSWGIVSISIFGVQALSADRPE